MSNSKLCSVDGCDRPHRAKGMCTTHRYRFDKGLPMDAPVRQYEHDRVCKVDGCSESRIGGDGTYCPMHRRRLDRHGDAGDAARQRAPFGEPAWSEPNTRRHKNLRVNYGLTVEEYDRILAKQKGRCAVCRSDDPGFKRAKAVRSFCIDHDHVTGHVRGLLCNLCNRAIGMLKDDPDVIEAAAKYVRSYRQVPLFGPAGPTKKEFSMTQPGEMPAPAGETSSADGMDMSAPMDMGEACQMAESMAVSHAEAESRKVGM